MMKTKSLFIVVLFAVLLVGCMPKSYYQMFKVAPTSSVALKDNYLVYEDDNCKVSYDFWGDGGDIGFRFYNKTAQSIYLNLEESFFVLNGVAYDYYQNRVYTNSLSTGATTNKAVTRVGYFDLNLVSTNAIGLATSAAHSVSYNEEKTVCIPSMTSKTISEYTVNKTLYRDCDLLKYPSKREVKTKKFTKTDSPFVFSNRIVYSLSANGNPVKFENEFYVTEITNYPDEEITELKYEEFCNQKSDLQKSFFKSVTPDAFYINYKKGTDYWKH